MGVPSRPHGYNLWYRDSEKKASNFWKHPGGVLSLVFKGLEIEASDLGKSVVMEASWT